KIIPYVAYEREAVNSLVQCFQVLTELDCSFPVVIALTLTNTKNLQMASDDFSFDQSEVIDEDTLMLPETIVEDSDTSASKILKPMFDLVWNACGYPASKNFDAEGNWVDRR